MKKIALLVIDVQKAFDELRWGTRNNLSAESNISTLLTHWRKHDLPVIHIKHSSIIESSSFHPSNSGSDFKEAAKPLLQEKVFEKFVNSAFIGTSLENYLRENNLNSLVIVGLTTDHCVSTSTRMAANLGFDVVLVSDATATFNKTGHDGIQYSGDEIHKVNLASLNNEFCTVQTTEMLLKKDW